MVTFHNEKYNSEIYPRDISQAYCDSENLNNCTFSPSSKEITKSQFRSLVKKVSTI